MRKIKTFNIKGLRGIRDVLELSLDQRSILLYGENASGKSSISDAFEWFYSNRIDHLSSAEIGRDGIEGLRNVFLDESDDAFLEVDYDKSELKCRKSIVVKKGSLLDTCSNSTNEFNAYLQISRNENLILRYKDLLSFILASKKDRLEKLSVIIGFTEITNTRDVFKTAINSLKKEMKSGNFDTRINTEQSRLIEYFGHNITSDEHYVESTNKLLQLLGIEARIIKIPELDELLKTLKQPQDVKIIEQRSFFDRVGDFATNLTAKLTIIENDYSNYCTQYEKIAADVEKIKKIILENLLREGVKVLQAGVMEESCPLCLQPKQRTALLREIQRRLLELTEYKTEKAALEESRNSLKEMVQARINEVKILLSDGFFQSEENKNLMKDIEIIENQLENYLPNLKTDVVEGKKIKTCTELTFEKLRLETIQSSCKIKSDTLKERIKDNRTDVVVKMEMSRNSFLEVKKLQKEMEIFEKQQTSVESVFAAFVKLQKESLEQFLLHFSKSINDLYQFMNPSEKVENIMFVPMINKDELVGLTLEFNFYSNKESPPHKYLSESHLNCLGIAFFLTSVIAFNKENGFFILDDVISSFDTAHRTRFAHLLIEKFSDYQIIVLTHEKNWYEYTRNLVKDKNWIVKTVKWDDSNKNVCIDEELGPLKEQIESKINKGPESGLGNDIRKYLEHILKEIVFNLKVKVNFLYNDRNEDRMAYELLSEMKSKLNKSASSLKDVPVIARLLKSVFICNKDSHDSAFTGALGDMKALWADIRELECLFYCNFCTKCISLGNYDSVEKQIRCKCGAKTYDWQG